MNKIDRPPSAGGSADVHAHREEPTGARQHEHVRQQGKLDGTHEQPPRRAPTGVPRVHRLLVLGHGQGGVGAAGDAAGIVCDAQDDPVPAPAGPSRRVPIAAVPDRRSAHVRVAGRPVARLGARHPVGADFGQRPPEFSRALRLSPASLAGMCRREL